MANVLFRGLRKSSSLLRSSSVGSLFIRSNIINQKSVSFQSKNLFQFSAINPFWVFRNLSYGSVNLVISEGTPKFETHEVEPPKKEKWKTKKRLKLQRKREKQKRKAANKRDPRRLGIKRKKKPKFANAEERIKCKLEKARIKEAMLIERLKRYEVPRVQGPVVEPHNLTGEERFYLKKMAQKKSNYVPIGRRGVFGGVILNMHMHWKKHETVKVICKPCKPGQVHEYAQELARLSGGIPIHIIGDNTIIFYRGKNYVQPEVMSPIDTLSKKRALEKSKYEQSLESVRRFIAIAEKELELYYRHIALYGDPQSRNPLSMLDGTKNATREPGNYKMTETKAVSSTNDEHSAGHSKNADSSYEDDSGDELGSLSELDSEEDGISDFNEERTDDCSSFEDDSIGDSDVEEAERSFSTQGSSSRTLNWPLQIENEGCCDDLNFSGNKQQSRCVNDART